MCIKVIGTNFVFICILKLMQSLLFTWRRIFMRTENSLCVGSALRSWSICMHGEHNIMIVLHSLHEDTLPMQVFGIIIIIMASILSKLRSQNVKCLQHDHTLHMWSLCHCINYIIVLTLKQLSSMIAYSNLLRFISL